MKSVADLRTIGRTRLEQSGVTLDKSVSALEIDVLLVEALGISRDGSYSVFLDKDRRVSSAEEQRFFELLNRRLMAEPIAYIVGEKEFYSRVFKVNQSVLIPRPETELLVQRVLELVEDRYKRVRIVDVGTGSGNIIITLVLELLKRYGRDWVEDSEFIAVDTSQSALRVAFENSNIHAVSDYIQWICGDLLPDLGVHAQFDAWIVVSNPPYVCSNEILSREVAEYEPSSALFAGPKGMDVVERLIKTWSDQPRKAHFNSLLIEIGDKQSTDVESVLKSANLTKYSFFNDLSGIPRIVEVRRS